MSLLQKILYVYLNTIARIAFKVYFRRIRIFGAAEIPHPSPTIISPNHPNTMVDPVLMASFTPGWMYFLANYGLFKKPLTNFLMSSVFFSIPVQRPKDVEKGKSPNNLTTIKRCCQVLSENGTFFMGPEASSFAYRRIRPLQDGIARIALTAAKRQKFNSGIIILPIGTNYSASTQFRSEIIVRVGQAIKIAPYKEAYQKDKAAVVKSIMDELRSQLETLSIHTQDEVENQFLEWLEALGASEGKFYTFEEKLAFAQHIIPKIRTLRKEQHREFSSLWHELYLYFKEVNRQSISDVYIKDSKPVPTWKTFGITLSYPFILIGKILNFPWFIPSSLYHQLQLYKSYRSMVELLVGVVFIPLLYFIVLVCLWIMFSWKIMLGYLVIALLLLLCLRPYSKWRQTYQHRKNTHQYPHLQKIQEQRASIIRQVTKLKLW